MLLKAASQRKRPRSGPGAAGPKVVLLPKAASGRRHPGVDGARVRAAHHRPAGARPADDHRRGAGGCQAGGCLGCRAWVSPFWESLPFAYLPFLPSWARRNQVMTMPLTRRRRRQSCPGPPIDRRPGYRPPLHRPPAGHRQLLPSLLLLRRHHHLTAIPGWSCSTRMPTTRYWNGISMST